MPRRTLSAPPAPAMAADRVYDAIYALGTVTTVVSLLVMAVALGLARWLARRQRIGKP